MANQITESIPLSASPAAPGGCIEVNSSTEGSPTTIHVSGSDTTRQHVLFVEAHNSSADIVIFHVYWQPIGGSLAASAHLTYRVEPYGDVLISNGLRIGHDTATPTGIAVSAYLDDSGDTDKIKVRGHAIVVDQPLS